MMTTVTTQEMKATSHDAPCHFADHIQQIANEMTGADRLGNRVYISAVWERVQQITSRFTWKEFAVQLVQANQAGELELHRADMRYDVERCKASEISYLNATFNFIAVR